MNFQPVDRLPVWEWAMWWDKMVVEAARLGLEVNMNNDAGWRGRRP